MGGQHIFTTNVREGISIPRLDLACVSVLTGRKSGVHISVVLAITSRPVLQSPAASHLVRVSLYVRLKGHSLKLATHVSSKIAVLLRCPKSALMPRLVGATPYVSGEKYYLHVERWRAECSCEWLAHRRNTKWRKRPKIPTSTIARKISNFVGSSRQYKNLT